MGNALSNLEGGDSYEPLIGLTLRVAYSRQCVGCAGGQLACFNGDGTFEGAILNLVCGYHNGSKSLAGDLVVCIQCVDADLHTGANLLAVEACANNVHSVQLCISGEASILNNDGGVSLLHLGSRGVGTGRLGGCRSGGGMSLSLGSLSCLGLRSLCLWSLGCVAAGQGRSLRRCLLINNLLLIGGCFCRKGCRDCCYRSSGKSCRSCNLVNATGSLRHFSSISELSMVNLSGAPPSLRDAQIHIWV